MDGLEVTPTRSPTPPRSWAPRLLSASGHGTGCEKGFRVVAGVSEEEASYNPAADGRREGGVGGRRDSPYYVARPARSRAAGGVISPSLKSPQAARQGTPLAEIPERGREMGEMRGRPARTLGGRRKGENPEEPLTPRQTFPSSRDAERGRGRPGGWALGRPGPFVKRRHLHKVGPLPFCPLPQPRASLSLCERAVQILPPKNEVEQGIRKEGGKYSLAISFRYWSSPPFRPGPLSSS